MGATHLYQDDRQTRGATRPGERVAMQWAPPVMLPGGAPPPSQPLYRSPLLQPSPHERQLLCRTSQPLYRSQRLWMSRSDYGYGCPDLGVKPLKFFGETAGNTSAWGLRGTFNYLPTSACRSAT